MKTVTKIALNNLKADRVRNILIGIAIFLTTALLTMIGLGAKSIIDLNLKYSSKMHGEFYGTYINVSESQLKDVNSQAYLYDIGKTDTFASVDVKEASEGLVFMDNEAAKSFNFTLESGRMPEEENEIAAPKEFFQVINDGQNEIGDTISITYRVNGEGEIKSKDFKICGIVTSSELNNSKKDYKAFVSEECYKKEVPENSRQYSVCFKVKKDESLNLDEMTEKIKEIGRDLGVDPKNIIVNSDYLMWVMDPNAELILSFALFGVLIIVFSIVVIYNIFYVGLIQRIHEFGKLRALGTTKKQLKLIIKKEGLLLSSLSIPLGLLAGYIGTDIFFYKVWMNYLSEFSSIKVDDVSIFNGYIMVGVAFITLIIVYLSLNKPMRTACNVSAIDAIRYDESSKNTKRKAYFEINLLKLTASNFVRNKKRTVTTILTMGLSCIFFVVIANLVESMDPSNIARREVEKGDFCILIDGKVNDVTYPENNYNNLQKQNIMSDDFLNSISKIDGVTNIEKRSIVLGQFDNLEFKDGEDNLCLIDVLSREDFDARIKDYKRGEMDYDSASDKNGIIYEYDNVFDQNGFEIGKDYDFTLFDGSEKIAFKGNLQGSCQSTQSSFIMTEDTFKILNIKNNLTTKIWISCDKNKEPNIKKILNSMISANEHLKLKSYSEELKNSKIAIRMYGMPVYAALIILGVIGFMNMANTLITSIITRKKELGILQAIGLTTRQLNKMLQLEGLIYTISTVFIACTLGNALGYMVCLHCQKTSLFGISEYHFPYLELGIMVAALIILQGSLSYILSKKLQKTSLVERIKYSE